MSQSLNNFGLSTGETNIALSQAILVYTDEPKAHSGTGRAALYATVHPVQNFGTEANPNFQIAAGSPLTREALLAMFESLAKKHSLNTDIIPENVLSISADHMVWWMPAGERNVFFNNKELGKRAEKVPHPALMFAVVKGGAAIRTVLQRLRLKRNLHRLGPGSTRDFGQRDFAMGERFLR
jgi:PRTRC genetic system protein B